MGSSGISASYNVSFSLLNVGKAGCDSEMGFAFLPEPLPFSTGLLERFSVRCL